MHEKMPTPEGRFSENRYLMHFFIRTGDYPYIHDHDGFWEFNFITNGSYEHEINGVTLIQQPGCLNVLRPEDSHCTKKLEANSSYINFCIKADYFSQFLSILSSDILEKLKKPQYIEIQTSKTFRAQVKRITDTYFVSATKDKLIEEKKTELPPSFYIDLPKKNPSDYLRWSVPGADFYPACDRLLLVMTDALIEFAGQNPKKSYSKGVDALLHLLSKPENLTIPLSDLIAQANYSYSHLIGLFKQEVGVTPFEYLRNQRVAYAKRLLTNSNYTNDFIAAQIGFTAQSTFCSFFKEQTGYTPSQYAKIFGMTNLDEEHH